MIRDLWNLEKVLGWFSVDMGIDLGTCNTLVCVSGEGIVLNEPSVVGVRKGTTEILRGGTVVGDEAKDMLGKTPGTISAIRPMRDGVIIDAEITEAMLAYFIRKVTGRSRLFAPRVVIAVPPGITAVQRQAVLDSGRRAGARRVYLLPQPLAAAMGAGLPFREPTASMIVDIGGGTTDIAIISLGDMVTSESVCIAGDKFDEAIIAHMKKTHNMMIGEQTAERIKIEIGNCAPLAQSLTMSVRGRNMVNGLPKRVEVGSDEIREALLGPVTLIVEKVIQALQNADAELSADLVDNGIVLAGGGAMLRGLPQVIEQHTGLAVRIADDPLTCVARGTAMYLENLQDWKDTMESDSDEG